MVSNKHPTVIAAAAVVVVVVAVVVAVVDYYIFFANILKRLIRKESAIRISAPTITQKESRVTSRPAGRAVCALERNNTACRKH